MWNWDEISRELLQGAVIATPPSVVVHAFERAERLLGRDWVDSCLRETISGPLVAASSVLSVVGTGRKLATIEGAKNAEQVLARIRAGDRSARSELTAAFLCMGQSGQGEIELGVPVVVSATREPRVPDFRLRIEDDVWTYVEVTSPDTSKLQQAARRTVDRLALHLHKLPMNSSVEILLRRAPEDADLDELDREVANIATAEGPARADLPGLALLLANQSAPADVVVADYGESVGPRLMTARALVQIENGVPTAGRHIVVGIPFLDERAELFLRTEAKQLPSEYPGIVMIDLTGVPAPLDTWEALIRRRLQPTLHTRVSAVCLFSGAHVSSPDGDAAEMRVKLIRNPNAKHQAPEWILGNLTDLRI